MLDPKAVTELVEKQIAATVNDQVIETLANENWVQSVEERIIRYTQDRILGRFNNSEAMPELIDAVKISVANLFDQGQIPGVADYVDSSVIKQAIDTAVQQAVEIYISELASDPAWIEKIQRLADHWLVQKTLDHLNSVDIQPLIKNYISELKQEVETSVATKLNTPGIQDVADQTELIVDNQTVTVSNTLKAQNVEITHGLTVTDLAVKGAINVNNRSWDTLAENISQKTLDKLTAEWQDNLVASVTDQIKSQGIDFENITVDGQALLSQGALGQAIVHSNLQTVGTLKELTVAGDVNLSNTVTVQRRRLGINTVSPESALSVWDEEVALIAGKYKENSAQIGTTKKQSLNIVVNRTPAVEIDADGTTSIKKLKVGVWNISFATQVPNYSGARGDIVFNSNPSPNDAVFAWVCLGTYQWKSLRAVE